ncbi:unnamed protein product, partial [Mesorhabditis spiculigera]
MTYSPPELYTFHPNQFEFLSSQPGSPVQFPAHQTLPPTPKQSSLQYHSALAKTLRARIHSLAHFDARAQGQQISLAPPTNFVVDPNTPNLDLYLAKQAEAAKPSSISPPPQSVVESTEFSEDSEPEDPSPLHTVLPEYAVRHGEKQLGGEHHKSLHMIALLARNHCEIPLHQIEPLLQRNIRLLVALMKDDPEQYPVWHDMNEQYIDIIQGCDSLVGYIRAIAEWLPLRSKNANIRRQELHPEVAAIVYLARFHHHTPGEYLNFPIDAENPHIAHIQDLCNKIYREGSKMPAMDRFFTDILYRMQQLGQQANNLVNMVGSYGQLTTLY